MQKGSKRKHRLTVLEVRRSDRLEKLEIEFKVKTCFETNFFECHISQLVAKMVVLYQYTASFTHSQLVAKLSAET
jgi:hypothetical protein